MSLKLPLEEEREADDSPLTERRSSLSGDIDDTIPPGVDSLPPRPTQGKWSTKLRVLLEPIGRLHRKTRFLKRLPAYVLLPITILIVVNCAVWAIVGIILRYHPYT
jgi:hypothetical protein